MKYQMRKGKIDLPTLAIWLVVAIIVIAFWCGMFGWALPFALDAYLGARP